MKYLKTKILAHIPPCCVCHRCSLPVLVHLRGHFGLWTTYENLVGLASSRAVLWQYRLKVRRRGRSVDGAASQKMEEWPLCSMADNNTFAWIDVLTAAP